METTSFTTVGLEQVFSIKKDAQRSTLRFTHSRIAGARTEHKQNSRIGSCD